MLTWCTIQSLCNNTLFLPGNAVRFYMRQRIHTKQEKKDSLQDTTLSLLIMPNCSVPNFLSCRIHNTHASKQFEVRVAYRVMSQRFWKTLSGFWPSGPLTCPVRISCCVFCRATFTAYCINSLLDRRTDRASSWLWILSLEKERRKEGAEPRDMACNPSNCEVEIGRFQGLNGKLNMDLSK